MWKLAPAARKARSGLETSVHFTESCDGGAPHLIVDVTPTSATAADGDIVGALHERLAEHQLLAQEHLMERGSVDAGVLAESQERYHVDSVGPVMSDTSWASQGAGRFGQSDFRLDWQAKQVICQARTHQSRLGTHPGSPWEAESASPVSSPSMPSVCSA
jgi:hypothetical protein